MKEITLDEYIARVQSQVREEPPDVTEMIQSTAKSIMKLAESPKVCIISDYDADGICSAIITMNILKLYNPDVKVQILNNDRRNAYGVPKDLKAEPDTKYIVQDMGCLELPYIKETFGSDAVIIDHHLFGEKYEDARLEFQSDPTLLNPHCVTYEDGKSSDYCATGLAYRIYQEMQKFAMTMKNGRIENFKPSNKLDNTLKAYAAIGTIADVVDQLDPHSRNGQIVEEGLHVLNNSVIESAEISNINFLLGYMFKANKLLDKVITETDISFSIAPNINAASRLGGMFNINGAQMLTNVLIGDENDWCNHVAIENFSGLNVMRKDMVNSLSASQEVQDFIKTVDKKSNIVVCIAPEDTPNTFCGLLASKLVNATDKSVIVLTKKHDKDGKIFYAGSGRNSENSDFNLKEMVDQAVKKTGIEAAFGGHAGAIGFSCVKEDDLQKFTDAILEIGKTAPRKSLDSMEVLSINLAEAMKDKNLPDKLLNLPAGALKAMPPIVATINLKDFDTKNPTSFIANNPNWIKVSGSIVNPKTNRANKFEFSDFSYSAENYPKSKDGEVQVLLKLGVRSYVWQDKSYVKIDVMPCVNKDFIQKVKDTLAKENASPQKG